MFVRGMDEAGLCGLTYPHMSMRCPHGTGQQMDPREGGQAVFLAPEHSGTVSQVIMKISLSGYLASNFAKESPALQAHPRDTAGSVSTTKAKIAIK